jgi:DNA mismatch repair protein MutS
MVEMSETANILNNATKKSFIIFDEIGRGTATYDGMSIAQAVLEYTSKIGTRCLFATHYHELTKTHFPGVKNLTIKVAETDGDIVFLHKIIDGVASRSYGVHVAKMAGMPDAVVKSAMRILTGLEKDKKNVPPDIPLSVTEDADGQLSMF